MVDGTCWTPALGCEGKEAMSTSSDYTLLVRPSLPVRDKFSQRSPIDVPVAWWSALAVLGKVNRGKNCPHTFVICVDHISVNNFGVLG